ncbi:MAG: hypothetical protein DME51_13425 [Verrucomicrobia bacterium]|nr:MAG: hypothetical protein DME51_13425 [Verrucomicrobiota bacterium]
MREARPFRAEAIDLSIPTYVFTLASLNSNVGQTLVSVAQVTKHFEVGEPNSGHVHHVPEWWKADVDGKHLILVSDRFLLWPEPVFVAAKTQKQSRYGKNIASDNLHGLLRSRSE